MVLVFYLGKFNCLNAISKRIFQARKKAMLNYLMINSSTFRVSHFPLLFFFME